MDKQTMITNALNNMRTAWRKTGNPVSGDPDPFFEARVTARLAERPVQDMSLERLRPAALIFAGIATVFVLYTVLQLQDFTAAATRVTLYEAFYGFNYHFMQM